MVTDGDTRSMASGAAPPCRGPHPLSSRLQRGNGHKPPPVTMLVLSHIVMLHWDLRFPWSANFIFSWWNFECNFVTSAMGRIKTKEPVTHTLPGDLEERDPIFGSRVLHKITIKQSRLKSFGGPP